MMYGIDISSYDKRIDLSKGNYDFCIVKATEGSGYKEPNCEDFVVQLTKLNKLIGLYHFARPDKRENANDAAKEMDDFVTCASSLGMLGKAILVIDWEVEPLKHVDYLEAMCKRCELLSGVTPVIYASKAFFNWVTKSDTIFPYSYPWWVAYWPSIKGCEVGVDPGLQWPNVGNNMKIWQYTETGTYPKLANYIDLNMSTLTPADWMRLASKKVDENLSDAMKWAIENGIFVGYPDGTYRPNATVTRNELAIVCQRLYKLIKG